MSKIEQLFQCIVCGAAWDNIQSLRAHMKAHKGEYLRTSIQVKKNPWAAFNELCKDHKTTTCHVLNTLIEGILQGAEAGDINLPRILSPNPVIINMTQVFTGTPRSPWKVDVTDMLPHGAICPRCGSGHVRKFTPEQTDFLEISCLRCGASSLIGPSRKTLDF